MKTLVRCALLVLAAATAACSTYRQDYSYDPAPAVSGQAAPRVMAAVFGVLRGDSDNPAGVDVRLRLEAGADTAEVRRDEVSLVTADLVPLELVSTEPALSEHGGVMLAPAGGAGTWRLVFAFPPGHDVGSLDLTGLVFTWRYHVGSTSYGGTVSFEKVVEPIWFPVYYGPWGQGPWGYGRYGWYRY